MKFVPTLSPKYEAPEHLRPLVERLDLALAGVPQRLVVHSPPRHGKTETLLHFIARALRQRPDWTIGYGTYNANLATSKSRVAQDLAVKAGVRLRSRALGEWRTFERGGMLAVGVGGGLTGQGVNIGIVDDPIKGRLEAESSTTRERTWDWFTDVFFTRLEPGASCIVNMTRWHPDDLAGRLIRDKGWEYICLPAIRTDWTTGEETALWPSRRTLADLHDIETTVGPYTWESLYQGSPRPRGGTVFGDPYGYEPDKLPRSAKIAIGVDLAYSKKAASDWSVAVVMMEAEGMFYVLDVVRRQTRAPEFKNVLRALKLKYPRARMRWYAAGTEDGSADFIREADKDLAGKIIRPGVPLETLPPVGDKFVRAIAYAAAWNRGAIAVPSEEVDWVDPFIVEHAGFTGVSDDHDDQVDAAVAAFDLLSQKTASYADVPQPHTQRRM